MSLLDFWSKFFLKMLTYNCCPEGAKERILTYVSVSSASAGAREKGKNNLRGKVSCPQHGFCSRELSAPLSSLALLKPWRTVCFVCGGDSLGWRLLVLLALLPKRCSWLHLKSNKHMYRQVQWGMNEYGMPSDLIAVRCPLSQETFMWHLALWRLLACPGRFLISLFPRRF